MRPISLDFNYPSTKLVTIVTPTIMLHSSTVTEDKTLTDKNITEDWIQLTDNYIIHDYYMLLRHWEMEN